MDWICEKGALSENILHNLQINNDYVELKENHEEGYLETPIIETERFTEITPSWNSKTNIDSSVELLIRIRAENKWTPYISYGVWSTNGNNIGIKERESHDLMKVTSDRIFVKDEKFGDAVHIKVVFKGNNPKLTLIAFSTDGGEDEAVEGSYLRILENIPLISQLASGHKDARVICSPTSLTMALKFHGKNVDLDQVARGTLDSGNGAYGNWPQNVAMAGELGMRAYTKRCKSINPVKNFIAKGIPVVASVCVQDKEQLSGAISAFPHGHLMVVVGFEIKDGTEYIVVNDPAANSDAEVRKSYLLDEWVKVWRHYVYIVTPDVEK
ncbi:C39 family peptidase [Sedimentibacter hydroxybenzoicus DSM 7310]|uniref:C39 family peptidase n=1 Tax=Sedimentibacter hydroxybenzoicus DSM 7310 TaxID=1123245 RepID=A0A974BHM9_SEDHY|nr:C39 family peptidase [Sedimentibacter hydroxybenzoicus]NYB73335.1 C39 family peptidase [Sedimentibacter hydroxybenzoicus DSM 7310]